MLQKTAGAAHRHFVEDIAAPGPVVGPADEGVVGRALHVARHALGQRRRQGGHGQRDGAAPDLRMGATRHRRLRVDHRAGGRGERDRGEDPVVGVMFLFLK